MLAKTQRTSQPTYLLIYSLWLLIPVVPLVIPLLAHLGAPPNLVALLSLPVLFGLVPLVIMLFPAGLPTLAADVELSEFWLGYLDALLLLSVPMQLIMLYFAGSFWCSGQLDFVGSISYLLTVGLFSGIWAINGGHELIHTTRSARGRQGKTARLISLPLTKYLHVGKLLGALLLSTVSFGTFFPAHLLIHHTHVGTPKDFYTAPSGSTIYSYLPRALYGNFVLATKAEIDYLKKTNRSFLSSDIFIPSICTLAWILVAYALKGWFGVAFFLMQSVLAIGVLDAINYLQHYGISRSVDEEGNVEPVREWHSWGENNWLYDIALINLFHHGDHHVNPQKPFYTLSCNGVSPRYPYPQGIMMVLSFFPPIFHRIAEKSIQESREVRGVATA